MVPNFHKLIVVHSKIKIKFISNINFLQVNYEFFLLNQTIFIMVAAIKYILPRRVVDFYAAEDLFQFLFRDLTISI